MASTNVTWGQTNASGGSKVLQIGSQHVDNLTVLPSGHDKKTLLLDHFGPIDPQEVRVRIINQKGGLEKEFCSWVLEDDSFKLWWAGEGENISWIHGDPGKGKTMIMEALIQELGHRLTESTETACAFFSCQRTDDRLNSASSILRGLIYSLIGRSKICCEFLKENYHIRPRESNATDQFWSLWSTFSALLKEVQLSKLYFCIDALDECSSGVSDLLKCINELDTKTKCYWVISSRNEAEVHEQFKKSKSTVYVSLELNSDQISNAVMRFIDVKVHYLAAFREYSTQLLTSIINSLRTKAEDTFLWVALVCQELQKVSAIEAEATLVKFPSGLEPLYIAMLERIQTQYNTVEVEICQKLIRTTACVCRPQKLKDIINFCDIPKKYASNPHEVERLMFQCGSFFGALRDDKVYFVHQSVTDFFEKGRGSELLLENAKQGHTRILSSLLHVLQHGLKRDMLRMGKPGVFYEHVQQETIEKALSPIIQYACLFWVDHLVQVGQDKLPSIGFYDGGFIEHFLRRQFFNWLETLAWLQSVSVAALGVERMLNISKSHSSHINEYLEDTRFFIATFRAIIDIAPLQVHFAGLIYSPEKSLVKTSFANTWPKWLKSGPVVDAQWGAYKMFLAEVEKKFHAVIAFSPDSRYVAVSLAEGESGLFVSVWEATTGERKGHFRASSTVTQIRFWDDSTTMTTAFADYTLKIWSVPGPNTDGDSRKLSTEDVPVQVSLSSNGSLAAFGLADNKIRIMDVATGNIQAEILDNHLDPASVWLSPDGKCIVCKVGDRDPEATEAYSKTVLFRHIEDGRLLGVLPEGYEFLGVMETAQETFLAYFTRRMSSVIELFYYEVGSGLERHLLLRRHAVYTAIFRHQQIALIVTCEMPEQTVHAYTVKPRLFLHLFDVTKGTVETTQQPEMDSMKTSWFNLLHWSSSNFSANGEIMVVAGGASGLFVLDLKATHPEFRLYDSGGFYTVGIAPDGKMLAFVKSNQLSLCYLLKRSDTPQTHETERDANWNKLCGLRLSDDGNHLFSGLDTPDRSKITTWNVEQPGKPKVIDINLISHGPDPYNVRDDCFEMYGTFSTDKMYFSPRGRYLLVFPNEEYPELYDLKRKKPIALGPVSPKRDGKDILLVRKKSRAFFASDETRVTYQIDFDLELNDNSSYKDHLCYTCDLTSSSPEFKEQTMTPEDLAHALSNAAVHEPLQFGSATIKKDSPLSIDKNWFISWGNEPIIWLPKSHRPRSDLSVSFGHTLVFASDLGPLTFLVFDAEVIAREGWFATSEGIRTNVVPDDSRSWFKRVKGKIRKIPNATTKLGSRTDLLDTDSDSE